MGETIIIVPCWWDSNLQSLVDVIKFQRPDLLPNNVSSFNPIFFNPPPSFFPSNNVPDVGELMLASFPLSLHFVQSVSPENTWWMGEKFDGIRCCWHSSDKRLYTRSGAMMELSPSIIHLFPSSSFLDTEAWLGRHSFTDSQSLLFPNTNKNYSDRLRFVAFDDPHPDNHSRPFEERYENVLQSIKFNHPLIYIVASRQLCTTRGHLEEFSNKVIEGGGEGVILRKPKSGYIPGRSPLLVKLKAYRGDDEALVVDVKGNSLTLQLPDETTFEVTSEEVAKTLQPKKGDVVSYTYENYTARSIPTKPQVYRIREDITWQHVLFEHSRKDSLQNTFNDSSQKIVGSKPLGYWVAEKKKNMRSFFEKFARSINLDPLLPSSWYSVSPQQFLATKGAHAIVSYYKGSFKKAIMGLFPEIGLDPTLFSSVPVNYWSDVGNRRKYLEKLAIKKGFDPLSPLGWYSASFDNNDIPYSILGYHGGSKVNVLIQLFPEIGLDVRKFPNQPRGYWGVAANQRQFFIDVAHERGFDYLVPQNWYSIGGDSSLSSFAHKARGGIALLEYYNKSFPKALINLFPEIAFDPTKFRSPYSVIKGKLSKKEFAKKIFDKFAEVNEFDPLIPSNWYSVRHLQVRRIPGATILMDYYKNIQEALLDVYPDIGLSINSFISLPRYHWLEMENRRKLFVDFAKQNNFDPLIAKNWNGITFTQMSEVKGASTLLRKYYKNNLRSALAAAFPDVNWTFNQKKKQ